MKNNEKYTRGQGKYDTLEKLCRTWLLFVALSFGGWAFETVSHYIRYSEFTDRGFLTLPLCPIYGSSIILTAYFFGVPQELDGVIDKQVLRIEKVGKWLKSKVARFIFYFLSVTVISTLAEFITGGIFKLIGKPLWDYSEKPLNILGVVCLSYSLFWGIMITLFMGFCWRPLVKLFERINRRVTVLLAFTLFCAVSVDFAVNLLIYFLSK